MCVMDMQIHVTSQIQKILINFCVVVNIILVETTVIHVVKALSKRLGVSQKVTSHLFVNHAIALGTQKNVNTVKRWMNKDFLWISVAIMKVVVFVRIAVTILKELIVTGVNQGSSDHMKNI